MAKGKRATALFEVIQAAKAREDKRLNKANRGNTSLLTPSWWFKSKNKNNGSTSRSEPMVSVEIPRPAVAPPAPAVKAAAKEAKRGSLISSLLSRKSTDAPQTKLPPSESKKKESPRSESSQLASSLFNADDESNTEASTSAAIESAPIEPAKPTMLLTDDMVDNEEALEFTEPAADITANSPAAAAVVETSSPQIIESTVTNESSSSSDEDSIESTDFTEPTPEPTAEPAVTDHKPVKLAVDRHRQQLNLRITYTSAMIGAFGIAVVIGLAFIIGKGFTHGPNSAGAASIESIRKGQPFPNVLEPARNTPTPAVDNSSTVKVAVKPAPKQNIANAQPAGAKIAGNAPQPAPQSNPQTASGNTPASASPQNQPAQPVAFNGRRIVGMQYVWIQSYPDPEDANDAVAELKKSGIDATAEKGLWLAPGWTTLIGTRAFDHTKNNSEYDTYLHSILAVSDGFAGSSKFKKFEPSAIRWREQQH